MSTERRTDQHVTSELPYEYSAKGTWADFLGTFAGVMLLISSLFGMLQGAAAVANDEFYADGTEYLYKLDMTVWGTIHLVIGVITLVVSVGILMRRAWGQITGVIVAGLSMVTNFAFLPYYPFWALTIIALDVVIVWALCTQYANKD